MKIKTEVKTKRTLHSVCQRSFKRAAKACWCSTNPDLFKSRNIDFEEIWQIPGITDVALLGNDSTLRIQSSKVLLAQLGEKFEQLLEKPVVKLNYPFLVVKTLHEFTLTGACIIDSTNLQSLLTAANEFNLVGIKLHAAQHLINLMDTKNIHQLSTALLCSKLLCAHVAEKTNEFVLENFEEMGQNDNFLKNCSPIWMQDLIKDETLNVNEEKLFQIVMRWASLSLENEKALSALLIHIRFGLMEKTFFDSEVIDNKQYMQLSRTRSGVQVLAKLDMPRVPSELVFAVGGYTTKPTSSVEVFDTRSKRWSAPRTSPFPTHAYYGIAVQDGKLYVIGGFGLEGQTNQFFQAAYCLDLSTKRWTNKSSMHNRRCYVSAVEFDGKI